MLVLTRKKGESIMIGEGIEITVLSSEGESIKLGITAPRDVEIYRKEIYVALKQSNRLAVNRKRDLGILNRLVLPKPKESQDK